MSFCFQAFNLFRFYDYTDICGLPVAAFGLLSLLYPLTNDRVRQIEAELLDCRVAVSPGGALA